MRTGFWAALAAIAVLWPGRLAGPLDGIPLDAPLEATAIGVGLAWLLATHPRFLREAAPRALIVTLLLWKAGTGALIAQDGWCLRFNLPVPVFVDNVTVPHSWDVRADWRTPVPACSAIMTRGYPELERFPAWFYNLAPATWEDPARQHDRPPATTAVLNVSGYLEAAAPGTFRVLAGEDIQASATIDGREVSGADLAVGVALGSGLHQVDVRGDLRRSHWSLEPQWNGENVWSATTATVTTPSTLDRWIRPWGRFVTAVLLVAMTVCGLLSIGRRARSVPVLSYAAGVTALVAVAALVGGEPVRRLVPFMLAGVALIRLPRRLQGGFGWSLLVALPFLTAFVVAGIPQAGLFTWYSSGDDWWMFQRFSYRIFMQGFWLQGGHSYDTFWFQPLYRWIAGSLHMLFGDSSVGELFWDAAAALVGAAFAFQVTRQFAGYRWGVIASIATLLVFTLGPAWHLYGRGLSEFSSAGFIYAAALLALRGRHGSVPAIALAAIAATLGFYTRLNNLPMALTVAAFAWPVRQPIGDLYVPSRWWSRVSRPVLVGVLGGVAFGMLLFTLRTYYYTGVFSMLHGTSASLNSVVHSGDSYATAAGNLFSSLMMLLSLNDPPRFDLRALPVIAGFAAAVLGALRVPLFRALPFNLAALSLAAVTGAFVARGVAYPGRFSTHLIPVTVALTVCLVSVLLQRRQSAAGHRTKGTNG
jgi:hypothetical protein